MLTDTNLFFLDLSKKNDRSRIALGGKRKATSATTFIRSATFAVSAPFAGCDLIPLVELTERHDFMTFVYCLLAYD